MWGLRRAHAPGHPRLLVIGLDGVPPNLLFDRMRHAMPNLRRLQDHGTPAALRTTDPPLSIPAWPVMFTGVDAGTLGMYGLGHRRAGTYTETELPSSRDVPVPTMWELLSQRGWRVGVVGMPPGYPPPAVNGFYISDFLTPVGAPTYTYPSSLQGEIDRDLGGYSFDVAYRSGERGRLVDELFAMTRQRFHVARALYQREPWDVFAVHEIGTDRLHHAFWKYSDPADPEYNPDHPFAGVVERYYALLDEEIGRLIALTDDRTRIVVVSDHGTMSTHGTVRLNQWLVDHGYLALSAPARMAGTPLSDARIDWRHTKAWSTGGYCARVYLNVRGREPLGAIPKSKIEDVRADLTRDLSRLRTSDGTPIAARVLEPRELYRTVRGDAPDLLVYFDELRWRSDATIGHESPVVRRDDAGPTDAVHSFDGVFLLRDPSAPAHGRPVAPVAIRDVMPTLLSVVGEPVPSYVQGQVDSEVCPHPVAVA